MNCKICNKELTGNKKMYCSNKCKQKAHYLKHKNSNTYYSQTNRGLIRKLKLINLKGGGCSKCGYNKNIAVLEFHHQCCKSFPLDMRTLSNSKWESIEKEADKCVLLCANCHREHHNPESKIENVINIVEDIKNVEKTEYIPLTTKCENCNKDFKKVNGKKYCSKECREGLKNYPTFDELSEKYNELNTWNNVAKYYNITRKIIQTIRNKSKS